MRSVIIEFIPAMIFLVIAGLGILLVLIWSKNFGARHQAFFKRMNETAALRSPKFEDSLHQKGAKQSAFLDWVDSKLVIFPRYKLLLIRSGLEKSPAQFLTLAIGISFVVFLFTLIVLRQGLGTALSAWIASFSLPIFYLSHQANKRRMKFEEQLPDALDFITRSLRAGHGLTASIGMAADELPDPVGQEFKITFDEINFGIVFPETMTNLMLRINSSDLSFFTIAVVIQRETGGNLTELLGGLSKTIRERIKLKGKVRILASEGKFSGYLLGGLPIILGAVVNVLNPKYMAVLWYTEQGHNLLITCAILLAIGAALMFKIAQIKV